MNDKRKDGKIEQSAYEKMAARVRAKNLPPRDPNLPTTDINMLMFKIQEENDRLLKEYEEDNR